jgi:hypothetical protein
VSTETNESVERFPLSAVSHNECKSFIKSLHPKNRSTDLVLYSDGSLEVDHENNLLDADSMIVLNVNDVEAIDYSGGRYNNRILYQLLGLVSLFSSFVVMFMLLEAWFDAMFYDGALTEIELIATFAPVLWIYFDLNRGKLAQPETITFNLSDGTTKQINGNLPNSDSYQGSVIIIILCVIGFVLASLDWGMQRLPLLGDIISYAIGFGIILLPFWLIWNYFKSDKSLSGIDSHEIPNGLTHMYFAAMSLHYNRRLLISQENQLATSELDDLRNKLMEHEQIIANINSANFIFAAPSPSLGLIAIRVSTETIMRNACEINGITWKPNARNTLISYLQKYKSEKSMDSKVESNIKSIIELGNRAAHDFNVDWDEFRIAATQFCEIVVWYSNTYYSEESE